MREIAQRPHKDAGHQDDATHFLEILLSFFPRVAPNGLPCWETIGRQLHHERRVVAFHQEQTKEAAQQHRESNAHEIKRHHDQGPVFRGEECARNHDVDGQARRTTHERQDEHGDDARTPTLNGARGHHRRHIATKTHDERDK